MTMPDGLPLHLYPDDVDVESEPAKARRADPARDDQTLALAYSTSRSSIP